MPRAARASIGPLASCMTLGLAGSASQVAERLPRRRGRAGRWRRRPRRPRSANASAVHVAGAGPPVPAPGAGRPAPRRRRARPASPPARRPRARASLTSKPDSSTASSSVGIASSSRVRSTWNSSPSKSVCTACRSHGSHASSAGPTARSRSQTRALSRRLRITSPRCSRSASPFLPVISSAWAMTLSRPSYWLIHLAAKPWPTPGTPGRLSEVSPTRAASSG